MLARTALRLITVAALAGTVDARPTIAADRVDDSRLADLAPESIPEDGLPVIMVIADDDDGEALSEQNGGPPFDRMIDLNLELSIASRVQYVNPDNQEASIYAVEAPDTDARLEASLDFLEFQTIRELAYGLSPYAIQFRKLARITHRACHRAATDDGVKIASRLLTLRCRVNDDDIASLDPSAPAPEGLDALPEPLRSVAKLLPEDSSGGKTCAALAAAMTQLQAGVPLLGVDFRADAGDRVKTEQPSDDEVVVTVDLQGS
jgi:hypothetical protein